MSYLTYCSLIPNWWLTTKGGLAIFWKFWTWFLFANPLKIFQISPLFEDVDVWILNWSWGLFKDRSKLSYDFWSKHPDTGNVRPQRITVKSSEVGWSPLLAESAIAHKNWANRLWNPLLNLINMITNHVVEAPVKTLFENGRFGSSPKSSSP